ASTNAGIDITGGSSQTGNLLSNKNNAGTVLSGFAAGGGLLMDISSTSALHIYNGATATFVVDTANTRLGIGTSTPATNFSLVGDMFLNTSNITLGTTTSIKGSTTTINAIAT